MSRLATLITCLSVLTLFGCSTSRIEPIRTLSEQDRAEIRSQIIPLRLSIVPSGDITITNSWEMRSVTNLAANLVQTSVFSSVAFGQETSCDLRVFVRKAYGVLRCGTSLPLTKVTLGLARDRIAYAYVYDFDFVSSQTGRSWSFQKTYQGTYRSGFWPPKSDGFVELLRFDLLHSKQQIENLLLKANVPASNP